jgi:NAD(P)H-flavin reductase
MANPPHESDGAQLHIRHVPGGRFSEKVLAGVQKRRQIRGRVARRGFLPAPGCPETRCVSCDRTGFAPLKSILEDLIKCGNKREVHLYWGGRRRQDLDMAELPEKWAARAGGLVQVRPGTFGTQS